MALDGGGWKGVSRIDDEATLRKKYEESGKMVMHVQRAVHPFDRFIRCVGLGPQTTIVRYDPDKPLHDRYTMDQGFLSADEAELLRVATAPAWRRRQVAQGLLRRALAEFDRAGIACHLEVRADNRPAQLLYERHRFAYLDRRPAYYRDGCAAWIYARRACGSG